MTGVFYVKHRDLDGIHKVSYHTDGYLMCELFRASNREWTKEHLCPYKSFEQVYKDCKDNPFNIISEDLDSILAIRELTS